MKTTLTASLFAVQMFTVILIVQSSAVVCQTNTRKIEFAKLSDYVDDSSRRRNGEVLIVTDVPPLGKVSYNKSNSLYFFRPDDNGDVGNTFYTSPTLAKVLRQLLRKGAMTARITCTLVQFRDTFDIYRSPFATKVEGFDENGKLYWTATGPGPTKLIMRQ
jgi:hypothetical protein